MRFRLAPLAALHDGLHNVGQTFGEVVVAPHMVDKIQGVEPAKQLLRPRRPVSVLQFDRSGRPAIRVEPILGPIDTWKVAEVVFLLPSAVPRHCAIPCSVAYPPRFAERASPGLIPTPYTFLR